MAGVYIHVPFCKQLCSYCDFYFSVSLQRTNELAESLLLEMQQRAAAGQRLPDTGFRTLYFGGGTPTVYSAADIQRLGEQACALFFPSGVDEWTIEANPDDLTPDYLDALRRVGVNRLSIGIQSFVDRDLTWMKRRHTAQEAIRAVADAQKAGFSNISIDLIYAIPGMRNEEWVANVQQAIDLGIQHISAYHLTVEPKTIIGRQAQRGLFTPVDDETGGTHYQLLTERLQSAGFEQYEVSNFAQPNYRSKHNSSYWQQEAYIGIGPSAHGYDGGKTRYKNIAHNIRYMEAVQANKPYQENELLNDADCYNEYVLTALRTAWGMDIERLEEPYRSYFLQKTTRYLATGRMLRNGPIFRIPSNYFIVSDSIVCDLFWEIE